MNASKLLLKIAPTLLSTTLTIGVTAIFMRNQTISSSEKPMMHGCPHRNSAVNDFNKDGYKVKTDGDEKQPSKQIEYDKFFTYFKLLGPGSFNS
jgi:hypothetical protein